MDTLHNEKTLGYWLKNGGNHRIGYYVIIEDECNDKAITFIPSNEEKGSSHIVADFIVPYPPGYPIFVPGQEITKEKIKKHLGKTISEVHGAITEGKKTKIPVYIVKNEARHTK